MEVYNELMRTTRNANTEQLVMFLQHHPVRASGCECSTRSIYDFSGGR